MALFMLPGAKYMDPELSWKYESGPAGTAFVRGTRSAPRTRARSGSDCHARSRRSAGTGGSIYRVR